MIDVSVPSFPVLLLAALFSEGLRITFRQINKSNTLMFITLYQVDLSLEIGDQIP